MQFAAVAGSSLIHSFRLELEKMMLATLISSLLRHNGVKCLLKLRFSEKATKFEKKNVPLGFDKLEILKKFSGT